MIFISIKISSDLYLFPFVLVVRPSMPETTALGAAMAAGAAEGVNVWSLDDEQLGNITTDTFTPSVTKKGNVLSSPC